MGTPEFAVLSLKSLIESDNDVVGVLTQPDKPKGRKYELSQPPVKKLALEYSIPVFQPQKLKDESVMKIISDLAPELIVVVAYGKILPLNIINFPKFGCVNVHASLLPKYRGAAPIQWSVINGEKVTGVTTMYMDEGLDTGDILLKSQINIDENETSGELHDKLSKLGSELIIKTIEEIKNNNLKRISQDNDKSCYAPMLNKDISIINWNKNAVEIHNLIRGLNPWPVAYTNYNGKKIKIYKSRLSDDKIGEPGEILSLNPFLVSCKDNSIIEILELQLEGKKRMLATDFLRGNRLKIGDKF